MKKGQLIGIAIAAIAGGGAFVLMRGIVNKAPAERNVEVTVNATDVLVAATPIELGSIANESLFRWQKWPQDAITPGFITRSGGSEAVSSLTGSIARAPILAGEPITSDKLIKPGQGGVLAAILPAGMRAISTKISEATAVGRLILPNDHVDVLLIRRTRGKSGEEFVSDTLFQNIRVLAIGQQIQNKEGEKAAASADTATLELTPRQTEVLALANSMGEISLALRSIADIPRDGKGQVVEDKLSKKNPGNSIRLLKYGNRSQATGVN
jgi:pilus assembly protein CpaB